MNANNYIDLFFEDMKSNQLKKILDSKRAYEILDNSRAHGGTWKAGGCAILAFALNTLFRYSIYVIYNITSDKTEHFMVMDNKGYLIDYDGKHQWDKEFNEEYKELEMISGEIVIKKWNSEINSDEIPKDNNAVKELINLFKEMNLKEI